MNTDRNKTDNELIAQFIANKDKNAFALLVEKHQSSIRQFLRRLTAGDHQLADDIAQETFILMFRKLHTFKGNSSLKTCFTGSHTTALLAKNAATHELNLSARSTWLISPHKIKTK